jgi:hypothetical protein
MISDIVDGQMPNRSIHPSHGIAHPAKIEAADHTLLPRTITADQ